MRRGRAVLFASLIAMPRLAAAQSAPEAPADESVDPAQEARQQYGAGAEAYAARRFVEAALHFEAAASRRPHAAALYNAALAWEQANRPDRAADDFSRALEVAGLNAALAQNARARIATLERTMGTLVVTAPEGVRVQLESNTEVPTPARVHATPGVHALMIVPPNGSIVHRDVTVELGKATPLALTEDDVAPKPEPEPPPAPKVEAKPAPPPPLPPPPPSWWNLRRGIGVGVVGLGVATLASGIVLGTSALGARDAYNAAPTQVGYDHASSLETWTNVAFAGSALFLAGGAALVLWPAPKARAPVMAAPAPGGVVVRGAF
jgi:hypothetical protein